MRITTIRVRSLISFNVCRVLWIPTKAILEPNEYYYPNIQFVTIVFMIAQSLFVLVVIRDMDAPLTRTPAKKARKRAFKRAVHIRHARTNFDVVEIAAKRIGFKSYNMEPGEGSCPFLLPSSLTLWYRVLFSYPLLSCPLLLPPSLTSFSYLVALARLSFIFEVLSLSLLSLTTLNLSACSTLCFLQTVKPSKYNPRADNLYLYSINWLPSHI